MMGEIGPIQKRVKAINQNPRTMADVLTSGAVRCKAIAAEVMNEVRARMGVKPEWMGQGVRS